MCFWTEITEHVLRLYQVVATVSCWSKYVNQTTEGPKQEDKEEENIDTKRDQFRTQGTRSVACKGIRTKYSNAFLKCALCNFMKDL